MSLRRQFSRAAGSVCQSSHRSVRIIGLGAAALSIVGGDAFAADGDANAALMKKLEKMERRIQSLEAELRQQQAPPSDASARPTATPASLRSARAAAPADQMPDARAKPAARLPAA